MAVHIMRRTESALFLLATMLVFCFPATSAAVEGGAPAEVEDAEGVSYTDRIVTAAWPGFFYVQQDDRAYGIRVDSGVSVAPGDRVTVTGPLNTPDGERTLTASNVEITSHGNPLPQPLYIRIPDLAGGSLGNNPGLPDATTLYNVGLLVKASGRVAEMGDGWLRIENGGGSVKVLYDGPTPPKVGGWARVTGISSIDASGSSPIPLIRGTAVTGWPGWFPHSIVFVGDSLTDGLDASAPDKVFNKQLLGMLQAAYPGEQIQSRVVFGVSGGSISNMLAGILADAGEAPDTVVIQDAAIPQVGGWIDTARQVIDACRTHWGKTPRIYFCDPWNPIDAPALLPADSIDGTLSPQLAALCAEYGDDVRFVPILAAGRTADGYGGVHLRVWNPDGGKTWYVGSSYALDKRFPRIFGVLSSGNAEDLYFGDMDMGTTGPWWSIWRSRIVSATPTAITVEDARGEVRGASDSLSPGAIGNLAYRRTNEIGDTLHPTDAGHRVIAETIFGVMEMKGIHAAGRRGPRAGLVQEV